MTDSILRAVCGLLIPSLGLVFLADCSSPDPEPIQGQQSAPRCGS